MRPEPDYYYENTDQIIKEMEEHAEEVFAEFKVYFPVTKYRELAIMMAKGALEYGKCKEDWVKFSPCWPFGDVEAYAVLGMEDEWSAEKYKEDEPEEDYEPITDDCYSSIGW